MLQSLRDEVQSAGDKEAATYDHFACFCKDTIAAKSNAVTAGTAEKNSLQASLDQEQVARQTADSAIAAAGAEVTRLEAALTQLQAERKSERLQYDKEQVDLTEAIAALQSAIHTLEAAKTATALVQLSALPPAVLKALTLADALGELQHAASSSPVLVALQEDPANYEFSSDDIITTLHNLLTRFANKKTEIANTEAQNRQTYEGLVLDNKNLIQQQRKEASDQQAAKALSQERIQSLTSDLSSTAAQLLDDQKYLAEVSGECSKKAELWTQRSQVRVDELSALTAALEIINSEKVSGSSSLVQEARSLVQVRAHKPLLTKRNLTSTPKVALPAQKQQVNRTAAQVDSSVALHRLRVRAADLLRAKSMGGKSLHGALLMRLASEVEEDPFAKVKVLIQQLIERLLKEAESEANHKGWCDTNMGVAAQGRDMEASKIKQFNIKLELSEARRAKLTNLISSLDAEMLELQTALNESATVRSEESAQNTAAITEAQEARDAVASAIRILSDFYGVKPPAAAMSLLHRSRTANVTGQPEIPDAGFSTEYSGAQGGAFSVLGMLEVLMGDFAKTASQVQAEETAAAQAFYEFSTATKASLAAKNVAFTERSASLTEADAEDSQARAGLVAAQAELGQLLDELDALYKACVDTSMTAEERKQHREEEIEALQEALNILENY